MSTADRESWERDCLAEVRRALATVTPATDSIEVHAVDLEGQYPDTKLVVELTSWGVHRPMTYELWGPDFEAFPGQREGPNRVGTLVYIDVTEEGRAPRRKR